jgi:hypothetical protein
MQDNPNSNEPQQQPNTEPIVPIASSDQSVSAQYPVVTSTEPTVTPTVSPAEVPPQVQVNTPIEPVQPQGIQPEVTPFQQPSTPQMTTIPQANPNGIITGAVQQADQPVQKKHSIKKLLIIVAVVAAALLVSIGGVLAYMSTLPTPKDHLEKAIINAASTNSLAQSAVMTGSIDGTDTDADIKIESDFSDPANPKTKGVVKMDFSIYGAPLSLASDFICVSKTECYIKYTESIAPDELGIDTTAYLNKWLQFDPTNDTEFADPFGVITGLNTVLGDIITGNISGDAKSKIEQAAKEGSAYSFTTATNEEVNGSKALKYDLTLNKDKVKELNNIVAKQYSLKADTVTEDITEKMNLWVVTDTNQIVRAESEVSGVKISLNFSKFGETITITAPSDYLTVEQYSQLF